MDFEKTFEKNIETVLVYLTEHQQQASSYYSVRDILVEKQCSFREAEPQEIASYLKNNLLGKKLMGRNGIAVSITPFGRIAGNRIINGK